MNVSSILLNHVRTAIVDVESPLHGFTVESDTLYGVPCAVVFVGFHEVDARGIVSEV